MVKTTLIGFRGASLVMPLTVLAALTCEPRVCAAPNGYTQIPIAKVFGNGVAAFSFSESRLGNSSSFYTTQYGLFNQFEVGIDYQGAPSYQRDFLGNAKYLLVHAPGRFPDIACGLQNITTGQRAVPYVVATTQPGALGFSLGLIHPTVGGVVGMGGVAYNVTPNTQIVGDFISGGNSYSTVGIISALTKTLSINLAYAKPNSAASPSPGSPSNPQGFVFNIAYVFHALHSSKGSAGGPGGADKNPTAAGGSGGG